MSYNTILATAPLTTQNYHLKMIGTSIGNSLIWDNGTNVGIGNTNTSYTLDVSGTGRFTSTLLVSGKLTVNNAASASSLLVYGGNSVDPRTDAGAGEIRIGSDTSYYGNIAYSNGGSTKLTIDNSYDNAAASMVFRMRTLGTPINALTILGTGAATFSSSVTIGSAGLTIGTSNYAGNEIQIGNGATDFAIDLAGSGKTDIYSSGSLVFNTALAPRMTITSGGNVGIGNTGTTNVRLYITGASTSSADYTFIAYNSSNVNLLLIRNDGLFNVGLATNSPYYYSTTGRTAILDSSGNFGYLVSTRESKSNIESIKSVDFINQLNPVQFNYRKKDNDTNEYTDELYDNVTYGFIADEVEKVNKELVFYNEDGSLAGVEYNSMIAILTKAVQELQSQINELKNK